MLPVADLHEDPTYSPGQTWWDRMWGTIYSWWGNIPKWIKIGIGVAIIVGLLIATVWTGGATGGLLGAVCAGALKGAVIGAVSGAVVSGTIGGIISAYHKAFLDGFVNGAADGFMWGAISGAIAGGVSAYSNYGNFASAETLEYHYGKHGTKMGYTSSAEYAKDAKYVIRNGTKVVYQYKGKPTVGYVKFWNIEREANYVLVGMNGTHTATFGIRRVSDLIDLGITLFVK